ncbi:MAG: O-antigen polymerase [Bacteroidota bacterium]
MIKPKWITTAFAFSLVCLFFLSIYTFGEKGLSAGLLFVMSLIPSLLIIYKLIQPVRVLGRMDFVQPLIFLFANVLLGITMRGMWMVYTDSPILEEMFTFGNEYSFFLWGAFLINIGMFAFMTGYSVRIDNLRISRKSFIVNDRWKRFNVYALSIVLFLLSAVGIYTFLIQYGVESFLIENISQKRFQKVEGTDIPTSSTYGRWLASLGTTGFIIFFTYCKKYSKPLWGPNGILLLLLFFEAIIFPFITNTRVGIISIFLFTGVIINYTSGLKLKSTVLAGSVGVFIVLITSTFRYAFGQAKNLGESISLINFDFFIEIFVANRNLLGIAKTCHIINAIPDKVGYEYGETMIQWMFAPIPRSIWASKPLIGVGADDAMKAIFNIPSFVHTGVPPGVIAEFYLNFGILGIIFGMFAFGLILKMIYRVLLPLIKEKNGNAIVLYIYFGYAIGFILPGTSFSPSMVNLLLGLIPLLISIRLLNLRLT